MRNIVWKNNKMSLCNRGKKAIGNFLKTHYWVELLGFFSSKHASFACIQKSTSFCWHNLFLVKKNMILLVNYSNNFMCLHKLLMKGSLAMDNIIFCDLVLNIVGIELVLVHSFFWNKNIVLMLNHVFRIHFM